LGGVVSFGWTQTSGAVGCDDGWWSGADRGIGSRSHLLCVHADGSSPCANGYLRGCSSCRVLTVPFFVSESIFPERLLAGGDAVMG
jgi:hypothetical protein